MAADEDLPGRLAEHVVPLERTAPGGSRRDLRPLKRALADRRVVGLGEATHGTREFFRLKHRLVRMLVCELDLRVFALEANFPAARRIDEYVVSGDGDARSALEAARFWTWQTGGMEALIEWMREYNAGRPTDEKIRFYGFDMQYARGAAERLGEVLERVDPASLDEIGEELTTVTAGRNWDGRADLKRWLIAAETVAVKLRRRFQRREDRYRAALTEREWRLLRRHRRILEQAHELVVAQTFEESIPEGVREAAMAENVEWILDHEDAERIAVWAHNGHVRRGPFRPGDWETPPMTMGAHLADAFGEDYYALGFEFGRGSFRARPDPDSGGSPGVRSFSIDSVPEGSVPAVFERVDGPQWFLDFGSIPDDGFVAEWLDSTPRLHNVGATYYGDDRSYVPVDLPAEFDGLVFVAEANRSMPLDG